MTWTSRGPPRVGRTVLLLEKRSWKQLFLLIHKPRAVDGCVVPVCACLCMCSCLKVCTYVPCVCPCEHVRYGGICECLYMCTVCVCALYVEVGMYVSLECVGTVCLFVNKCI